MIPGKAVAVVLVMLLEGGVYAQDPTILQCSASTTIQLDKLLETFKYPASGLYPVNTFCNWLFQAADPSNRITFEVSEIFVDCGDTLKFYDGSSTTATPLTSTSVCCSSSSSCGSTRPKQTSTGSNIFASFMADGTQKSYENGFHVSFLTGKDESSCPSSGTHNSVAITAETTLTSPNFPAKYPMSFTCTNTYTNPGGTVSVQFKYLDLEVDTSSPGACFDFVEILDGDSTSSPLLAKLCGTTAPNQPYTSSGESLTIKLTSDFAEPKYGFYASVTPVEPSTTTKSTTTTTTTTSPTTTTKTTTTSPTTTTKTTTTSPTTTTKTTTTSPTTTITPTTMTTTTSPTTTTTQKTTTKKKCCRRRRRRCTIRRSRRAP